jgi:hypothetical protein
MATCGQNVHWPQYKEDQWNLLERWRVKYNAKDKDCDMISEATKDMDETESNRWFCKGKPHHGVFERERSHVDTSEAPFERYAVFPSYLLC